MLFDNQVSRASSGFLCGLLLISMTSSAHAERVLTETIFDDDGVRSITYERADPSQAEEAGTQSPGSTTDVFMDPEPGLLHFLSKIFKGQGNTTDVDRGEGSTGSLERLETFKNTQETPDTGGNSETLSTLSSKASTAEAVQRSQIPIALDDDVKRTERIQAIFGASSLQEPVIATTNEVEEEDLSNDPRVPSPAADSESRDQSDESLTDQTDKKDNELPNGAVEEPNLVQRFFGFLKREFDQSASISDGSNPELKQSLEESDEGKSADAEQSFSVQLPAVQGQPEIRQKQEPERDLAQVPQTPTEQPFEDPNSAILQSQPMVKPPRLIEKEAHKSLIRKPPAASENEQSVKVDPNILNPMMIGKELDAFALGLIEDVRRGESRRPFQEFSKQISDVFFSTPIVLRLIELEKTINTQVAEAESLGLPQVIFSAEEGRRAVSDGGADGRISSQTVTATQSVWDFGIIESGVQQSRNNVEKTLAEIRDSRSEALLDLILAYNELATSRMNMRLVEVFAETRVQFLDLVDQKLSLGVSSQADLVRAEAKAYEAQGELPVAAQRLQLAEDRFVELFGIVPPDVIPLFKIPTNQLNLAELGLMTERHPAVVAIEIDYQNAQLELQRLSSERLGAVNFQLSGSRSDTPTTSSTDQLDGKIVYQVDLYDGGDLSARLERASGSVIEARWELERVRRETRRILESAITELVASQSLESARLNSLEATVKASDATKELFMYDRGDLTDIFRVQDDYLNAAKALVEARASSQNAFYSSLHAADLLIEQFGLGI